MKKILVEILREMFQWTSSERYVSIPTWGEYQLGVLEMQTDFPFRGKKLNVLRNTSRPSILLERVISCYGIWKNNPSWRRFLNDQKKMKNNVTKLVAWNEEALTPRNRKQYWHYATGDKLSHSHRHRFHQGSDWPSPMRSRNSIENAKVNNKMTY